MNANQSLTIRIIATRLPGRSFGERTDVRVGMQVGKEITDLVAGDARSAEWQTEVSAIRAPAGSSAIRGKAIHGKADERFLYLAWVSRGAEGEDEMFRRAKLQLDGVPAKLLARALAQGKPLVAELELTDAKGEPLCASVRPPAIRWSVA